MISRSLKIESLDAEPLRHLLALLDPPKSKGSAPQGASAWIDRLTGGAVNRHEPLPPKTARAALVLLRQGQVVRILLLGAGHLDSDGEIPPTCLGSVDDENLSRLRDKEGLALVIALRSEALPDLVKAIAQRHRPNDDPVAQVLSAARVLQDAIGHDLWISPKNLTSLPLPPYELLSRSFDRMLPDGRTLMFYIFDGGRVWTSLIARKRGGDIDLITSQRALPRESTLRKVSDLLHVRKLVEARYGPPHICLGVTLGDWQRFVHGDRSALARAIATRKAILDPAPAWLRALIGAGAVSEAASRSTRLAGKLLSRSPLGGLLGGAPERLASKLKTPLDALGLDPWELLAVGSSWTRRALPLIVGPPLGGVVDDGEGL